MFIHIRKLNNKIIGLLVLILIIVVITILDKIEFNKNGIVIGAFIHVQKNSNYKSSIAQYDSYKYYELDEQFQRPSKLPSVKLKYDFRPKDKVPPYIAEGFPVIYQLPEDVIHGYYAILKNAANMKGYYGGCGTILWMDAYPYAYRLLSESIRNTITLEEFKDSFKGTGAMNLLHLEPAYEPPDTPNNIKYYFVEVEVLKGYPYKKEDKLFESQPNYFEYYYGIVTAEYNKEDGWKIKSVDYLSEIYLCHPLHGWDYDYDAIIDIIYNDWYGMDLKIDNTEMENNYIQVYASNQNNEYKFDFIRLTNGDDVLLHEYIKEDNQWKEVSILKPDDEKYFKISILKFNDD